MSKPIRLFKLVTGELVLGKFDEEANMLEDVAIIQVVPTQQGVQMMMLPYGYPFEQEFKGSISGEHFMYEYKKLPDDLETKYLEALKLSLHHSAPVHGRPRRRRGQVSAHQVALSPLRTKTPPSCPGLFRDGGGEAFPQPRRLRNPSL